MYQRIVLAAALAATACGSGSGTNEKCPSGSEELKLTAENLADPSWLDAYPIDRVCLAKTTASADMFIQMHTPASDVPPVQGYYQYKSGSDTYGIPQHDLIDGASKYQRHGCDPVSLVWGIEVDSMGAVYYAESAGVATQYRIWVNEGDDCTLHCFPGEFCDPSMDGSVVVTGAKGRWSPEDFLFRNDLDIEHRFLFGERFHFDTSAR